MNLAKSEDILWSLKHRSLSCFTHSHRPNSYFGFTKEQLRKLAYELAWKNGMKHSFNVDRRGLATA